MIVLESANPSFTAITEDISAPQSTIVPVDFPNAKQDKTADLQKKIFLIFKV